MWKECYICLTLLICVPALSKTSIDQIYNALENTLEYILKNYENINVDCLFGVVFTEAILQNEHENITKKCREIYSKSVPRMRKQNYWNQFAQYIVRKDLWIRPVKYKLSEFRMAYAKKSKVEALFSPKTYENFSEGMSDECLSSVINSTLKLTPKTSCKLSPKCELFIQNLDTGSGYILTHKLLLLQLARARKCKMYPKTLATAMKKICTTMYIEMLSVEFFSSLEEIFDLFLEEILLCGYEGYADFLKLSWLEKILSMQHPSGCFPMTNRSRREANELKDGCVDHTTGLGAAVLALYLNYIIGNTETLIVTSDLF